MILSICKKPFFPGKILTRKISRTKIRINNYLREGRHYKAPINPYHLICIDPDKITKKPENKPRLCSGVSSGVRGGDWDQNTVKLKNASHSFRSIKEHFENNIPWKETEEYQIGLKRIKQADQTFGVSSWGPCRTVEDLERRFNAIDELYHRISQNGYKPQRELECAKDEMVRDLVKNMHKPPELREVSIYITRDGEFLWKDGIHRLAIAQILNIDLIPVQVYIRHAKWQQLRDKVYLGKSQPRSMVAKHPDINYLLRGNINKWLIQKLE